MIAKRPGSDASKAGFTLVEVLLALFILVAVSYGVIENFMYTGKQTESIDDKTFASQKVMQMLDELRGLVSSSNFSIGTLDSYNQGGVENVLTIKRTEANYDPLNPLSGNRQNPPKDNSKWRYYRTIAIIPAKNDPLARICKVRVLLSETNEVLAESITVLRSIQQPLRCVQVLDAYVFGIDNLPSMSLFTKTTPNTMLGGAWNNSLKPIITSANPGLSIRDFWITRSAYGRDPHYSPMVNVSTSSDQLIPHMSTVYLYPGMVAGRNNGAKVRYIGMDWYVLWDRYIDYDRQLVARGGGIDTVPRDYGSSVADQYNHAVRYPEELAFAKSKGGYTLRYLLEELHANPQKYKNALLVNMNGEMMSMPPMRNYSDAAKEPFASPGYRVVVHPEQLAYASVSDNVKLRLYSYIVPDPGKTLDADYAQNLSTEATILIKGVQVASQISVQKVVGDALTPYAIQSAVFGASADYIADHVPGSTAGTWDTRIVIFATPLRHPEHIPSNSSPRSGLPSNARLYDLEYIPAMVGTPATAPSIPAAGAWNNLDTGHSSSSNNMPKNTARWIVTIAGGALPAGQYTVETRMGKYNSLTGKAQNMPTNLSKTYFWLAMSPPETEKYQFIGDPRHMPYADVKRDHGYNWYFGDNIDPSLYPGFDKAQGKLWANRINVDLPRYFQILREGIMKSGAIFMNASGPIAFNYVGLGGEIGWGLDQSFGNSIKINLAAWRPGALNTTGFVDELTDTVDHNTNTDDDDALDLKSLDEERLRLIARDNDSWYGRYWLGELYPDSVASVWFSSGNLPVGPGNFYRAKYGALTAIPNSHRQAWLRGAPSFFNGFGNGSSSSYFGQEYYPGPPDCDNGPCGMSTIMPLGSVMQRDFNLSLATSLQGKRPYRLDHANVSNRYKPSEWDDPVYSGQRTVLSELESYYAPNGLATDSSLGFIRMWRNPSEVGNVVINGITNSFSQNTQLGVDTMAAAIRGFLSAGAPSVAEDPVAPIPHITINQPSTTLEFVNPSYIGIDWITQWFRWDGEPYTSAYPKDYVSSVPVKYLVKYSLDNGSTWRFIQDLPSAPLTVTGSYGNDAKALQSPYQWDVSNASAFPRGTYWIRIEAYRFPSPTSKIPYPHYTFNQRKISVLR